MNTALEIVGDNPRSEPYSLSQTLHEEPAQVSVCWINKARRSNQNLSPTQAKEDGSKQNPSRKLTQALSIFKVQLDAS